MFRLTQPSRLSPSVGMQPMMLVQQRMQTLQRYTAARARSRLIATSRHARHRSVLAHRPQHWHTHLSKTPPIGLTDPGAAQKRREAIRKLQQLAHRQAQREELLGYKLIDLGEAVQWRALQTIARGTAGIGNRIFASASKGSGTSADARTRLLNKNAELLERTLNPDNMTTLLPRAYARSGLINFDEQSGLIRDVPLDQERPSGQGFIQPEPPSRFSVFFVQNVLTGNVFLSPSQTVARGPAQDAIAALVNHLPFRQLYAHVASASGSDAAVRDLAKAFMNELPNLSTHSFAQVINDDGRFYVNVIGRESPVPLDGATVLRVRLNFVKNDSYPQSIALQPTTLDRSNEQKDLLVLAQRSIGLIQTQMETLNRERRETLTSWRSAGLPEALSPVPLMGRPLARPIQGVPLAPPAPPAIPALWTSTDLSPLSGGVSRTPVATPAHTISLGHSGPKVPGSRLSRLAQNAKSVWIGWLNGIQEAASHIPGRQAFNALIARVKKHPKTDISAIDKPTSTRELGVGYRWEKPAGEKPVLRLHVGWNDITINTSSLPKTTLPKNIIFRIQKTPHAITLMAMQSEDRTSIAREIEVGETISINGFEFVFGGWVSPSANKP